jgi:hypothetical protein
MKPVNCYAPFPFQVDTEVPDATTGIPGPPALGAVTGVKVRLSATPFGNAIHANVSNLAAAERAGVPGRFYYTVTAALLTAHVLPLGVGETFYAVWSKPNDFDRESVPYLVADGTVN